MATLDIVWETINTHYFDSTFSGLDWRGEYEYYRPIIASCTSSDSLYYHLNKMLFKLGVSHLGVVSAEEVNTVGDPQLFLDGSLGIDVRYINEKAIITRIEENSSADLAGIKAGYELTSIQEESVEEIAVKRDKDQTPPFNERNLNAMITQDIIRLLYGNPDDQANIEYIDHNNRHQKVALSFRQQSVQKATLVPDLPEIYARLSSRVISDSIGYIRFDVFHPVILDGIVETIQGYRHLPSIIIDIRGNPGGDFETRRTIVNQFFAERKLFWTYRHRNEIREVYTEPVVNPFTGNLVILVDYLSGSSSEEFAGGMKDIGRATIVGQQTVGKVLTMEFAPLPNGAFLIYPNSQTRTSKNSILEGTGVIPDVLVELTQESLLEGKDVQLEQAIALLLQ